MFSINLWFHWLWKILSSCCCLFRKSCKKRSHLLLFGFDLIVFLHFVINCWESNPDNQVGSRNASSVLCQPLFISVFIQFRKFHFSDRKIFDAITFWFKCNFANSSQSAPKIFLQKKNCRQTNFFFGKLNCRRNFLIDGEKAALNHSGFVASNERS